MGRDGVLGPPSLEQHLALQFPQIGVVRLLGDQGVDGFHGLIGLVGLVEGDGACIAGRERLVGVGIVDQGLIGTVKKRFELGLHQLVSGDLRGAVDDARVRLLFDAHPEGLDPVVRQRVVAEIGKLALVVEHFLVAEVVEEID